MQVLLWGGLPAGFLFPAGNRGDGEREERESLFVVFSESPLTGPVNKKRTNNNYRNNYGDDYEQNSVKSIQGTVHDLLPEKLPLHQMFELQLFNHRFAVITNLIGNIVKIEGVKSVNISFKTAGILCSHLFRLGRIILLY